MTRAAALSAVLLCLPMSLEAQQSRLLDDCVAASQLQDPTPCSVLVRSAAEIQASLGLAGSWSGVLPGAAHSLGKRFQDGPPRFSITGRVGFVSFDLPTGVAGVTSSRSLRPTAQAAFAGGVFEGFRLRPAVGGVLALDLFGTLAWTSTPSLVEGSGVQGGVGARLGLLRESFDVPALGLVMIQSWAGQHALQSPGTPSTRVEVTPRTTAVRAAVSKDVGGFGLGANLGRDWYRGRAALMAPTVAGELNLEDGSFSNSRWVGGVNGMLNYLVLFLEGELGWAGGLSGPSADGYDPGGSVFGSLSARLVF